MATYPNPWDFHNTDKSLSSNGNLYKVTYFDLNEIAMGAPLHGSAFLENGINQKIKIHNNCGGPAIWETDGHKVALPIWTKSFLKGTVQQIAIVDTSNMELTIFERTFDVLDLRSFDKNIVYGYDSPVYNTKTISFHIDKEKIEKVIKLTPLQ